MVFLVNSTKHLRKKQCQFSTISSRKKKQKERFLTHSLSYLAPATVASLALVDKQGMFLPMGICTFYLKMSIWSISLPL